MSGAELRRIGVQAAEDLHERYPLCTESEFLVGLRAMRAEAIAYAVERAGASVVVAHQAEVDAVNEQIEAAALARWRELRGAS